MHTNQGLGAVRWVVIVILSLATTAMVIVSMVLNFFYFSSYGQTPVKQIAFGVLSVIADVWKACAPVAIYELWTARLRRMATLGAIMWIPCFIVAVSSALGLLATDRMALTGGRETLRANYADVEHDLEEAQGKLKNLRDHRSKAEVDAAIATVLARPVGRTTVGALSRDCTLTHSKTAEACAEVAALREELAAAVEARKLEMRIAQLREESRRLRERGGTLASDPLGELYAFLSRGMISAKDVSFWLVFVVAIMGELLGAFGFALVAAFARVTRPSQTQPDTSGSTQASREVASQAQGKVDALVVEHQTVGNLMLYFTERTELTAGTHAIDVRELHADYEAWCLGKGFAALASAAFAEEFDRLRERPEVAGKIRKFASRYYGLRLVGKPVGQITTARRKKA